MSIDFKGFYTYLWLRQDGTPYYVGKGIGNRAFIKRGHVCIPPVDKSRILIETHPDENSAFEAERFLVTYYGRVDLKTGCLRNRTEGGEGASGRRVSVETRKKMSISKLGKSRDQQTVSKYRDKMLAFWASPEGKKTKRESMLKRWSRPEEVKRFFEWNNLSKEKRTPKTQNEYSLQYHINVHTLIKWKKRNLSCL
jgi:hypothetical protein